MFILFEKKKEDFILNLINMLLIITVEGGRLVHAKSFAVVLS